jgi:arginase
MDVCLIQVPFHAGDERHGSSSGPQRLSEAGAVELLAARGIGARAEVVDRTGPFRDTASSSAEVNRRIAALVREAVDAGELPVVLAGSCNAALGVLAGFDHSRCGAVWLDAHADFNTPESTASGFFAGMSAAIAAGHCYRDYWSQIGDNTRVAEEAFVMLGVRDVSPEAERERLRASAIRVVEWQDGKPRGDVVAALDHLSGRVSEVYLHVDFDVFAPDVAPGVADEPVPGGLSVDDAEGIVRATAERFRVRAVTLATYTPDRDRDDKTLRVALRLIELIGDYASER